MVFRKTVAAISLMLVATGALADDRQQTAASRPEPLVFRAADVLKPEVLIGPNYEIQDRVTLDGTRFQFRIKTPWGVQTADGFNMLEVRLREMYAIDRLNELARDPQVLAGLVDTLEQTPQGVRILLTDPAGALLRAPQGIEQIVSGVVHPLDRRAGSPVRRRLAVEVGCDPETTNIILAGLLDSVSLRKGIGQLAGKVGLSVALPGLGLIPLTADIQDMVANQLPHEINQSIDRELAGLGIDKTTRAKFLRSEFYTTSRRLLLMHHLRQIQTVDGSHRLVQAAAAVRSEADGLAVIQNVQLLAESHRRWRLGQIVSTSPPLATSSDGGSLIVWSADYLPLTQELSVATKQADQRAEGRRKILRVSGYPARETLQALTAAGFRIITGS